MSRIATGSPTKQPWVVLPNLAKRACAIRHGALPAFNTFVATYANMMMYSEDDKSLWHTTIRLPAGTHHLKFFVDGAMRTSPDIPTAVDFNNFLVNYVEISADDIRRDDRRESLLAAQKEPPKAISPRTDVEKQFGEGVTPTVEKDLSGTVTPGDEDDEVEEAEISPEEILPGDYRQLLPQALTDIDLPEGDERCKIASRVISDAGQPPQ